MALSFVKCKFTSPHFLYAFLKTNLPRQASSKSQNPLQLNALLWKYKFPTPIHNSNFTEFTIAKKKFF